MPKSATKIEQIKALVELERLGWKYEGRSEHEVACLCPVHERQGDHTPSVNLNTEKNMWNCKAASCGARGDIISFLCYIANVERQTMIVSLSERYDLKSVKVINPERVEEFHQQIWDAGPLLIELYRRGVTNDMIKKARLGYHDGRITIPVYDRAGQIINVRRYLPGAPGPEKMKNTTGYGQPAVYQIKQVAEYEQVWICGGEMKALVAGHMLNPHGIGACCVTAGEGAWKEEFTPLFKDKMVFICMDIDAGGKAASVEIAEFLYYTARSVRIINLPLDREKHPKGDINDYVGAEGADAEQLLDCMVKYATKFVPQEVVEELESKQVERVRLTDATNSANMGKTIEVECVITAMDTTPFLIPKDIKVKCSRNQPGCIYCPVMPINPDEQGFVGLTIKGTSANLLDMINATKANLKDGIRESLRIPSCKVCEFTVKSHFTIADCRLSPQLNVGSESSEHVVQPAFVVAHGLELNTPYIMSGRLHPIPKTQQAVLLLHTWRLAEDNLTSFAPKEEDLATLTILQPKEWTEKGISEKLHEIYEDMEANVTRIYKRRELHLAIDLVYHSVLLFDFDQTLLKGWVDTLIIGDSSQGKSETALRMMKHYNLGERVECKNMTAAGLIGGINNLNGRFFVTWGIVPTHDRRMVILEEVKGIPTDVIGRLTDLRSSGIAELSKIEKRRAHARTRLLWISNARSERSLSSYNFGVESIRELIGGLEDVRRFDLAVLVSSQQIDPEEINRLSTNRPHIEHRYSSEICRRAVLWAWTRKPNQVYVDRDAADRILECATLLCSVFTEALPLVDRGTMRQKIARLSVALAARTFSVGTTTQDIRVRKCHVDFIYTFIHKLYSSPVFGYLDFSKAQEYANKVVDPGIVKRQIEATKHPSDFVDQLLYTDTITEGDICDWCEADRDGGRTILSLLVRKHALRRIKTYYVKTSEFIALLKEMKSRKISREPTVSPEEIM